MQQSSVTDKSLLFETTVGSLPPATDTAVVAFPYTGDYRKDCLLSGLDARWNSSSPVGTNVSVTYSFATAGPRYADPIDLNGFTPFTAEQEAATRSILANISLLVGVNFTEVSDSASSYGSIRFSNNTQADSSGYAILPNSGNDNSGDVYISKSYSSDVIPGSYSYATLVHEIGHALGLKHPGNYNAGEPSSPAADNFLGVQDDKTVLTVMSYRESSQELQGIEFAPYDILTLRYLYGTRAHNNTDTTYSLTDAHGQRLNTIIDDGGIDTVNLSALTNSVILNLNPGSISSVGITSKTEVALQNLALGVDTIMENVVGSAYADTITLNSANNRVDGGAGIDTAIFNGSRSHYTTAKNSTGYVVSSTDDGIDTLVSMERLKFSDRNLAIDLDGNAGKAAKILGAIFGKESVSNTAYAGVGLSLLDSGMSYQDLVQLALNTKLGAGYGNSGEVNLLYQNLVGTLPSSADRDYWTGVIASGQYSQASLGVFAADSNLNTSNINLVGLANTGLEYV